MPFAQTPPIWRAALLGMMLLLPLQAMAEGTVQDMGAQALAEVNARRAQAGVGPLVLDPALGRAAAAHARDMQAAGYFGHTGSDGSGIADRVRRAGYGFCFVAENLARGQTTLGQVLTGWMQSPGHRRNMLHRDASGMALMRGQGNIWVMVLGRPGC